MRRWQVKAAFASQVLMIAGVQAWDMHRGVYDRRSTGRDTVHSTHYRARARQNRRRAGVELLLLLRRRRLLLPSKGIDSLSFWQCRWHEGVSSKCEDVVQIGQMAEVAASRRSVHDALIPGQRRRQVWPCIDTTITRRRRGRALRLILHEVAIVGLGGCSLRTKRTLDGIVVRPSGRGIVRTIHSPAVRLVKHCMVSSVRWSGLPPARCIIHISASACGVVWQRTGLTSGSSGGE